MKLIYTTAHSDYELLPVTQPYTARAHYAFLRYRDLVVFGAGDHYQGVEL